MKNKILVVAVHPDDETLGCGGTLLKHKHDGDEIYWLICTKTDENSDYYTTRENEIKQASDAYKFDGVFSLGLNTMRVDEYSMSELIGKVSKVISEVKPNIIYLPFKSEIGEHPFPRSERNLRALATLKGATCGCEYAESFMLLKEIL